ncbi:unnamed protein product [Fusarium graminearum]|nr:unnamed protein product [Fusarium graminearum]
MATVANLLVLAVHADTYPATTALLGPAEDHASQSIDHPRLLQNAQGPLLLLLCRRTSRGILSQLS